MVSKTIPLLFRISSEETTVLKLKPVASASRRGDVYGICRSRDKT